MSKGTLRADELKAAKVTIDLLANPTQIHTLFALVDTTTGRTLAWANGEGGMWSNETMQKLRELLEAMEEDAAKSLLSESSSAPAQSAGKKPPSGGIGEHLGDGDGDAPQL